MSLLKANYRDLEVRSLASMAKDHIQLKKDISELERVKGNIELELETLRLNIVAHYCKCVYVPQFCKCDESLRAEMSSQFSSNLEALKLNEEIKVYTIEVNELYAKKEDIETKLGISI